MRKSCLFYFGLALLALVSCKSSSNNVGPIQSGTDLFPLAVGDTWTYHDYSVDSNGVKVPGSDRTEIDSIVAATVVDARTAFIMRSHVDTSTTEAYLYRDSTGDIYTGLSGQGAGAVLWSILAPLHITTVGGTATYVITPFPGISDTTSCTYVDMENVGVPAGNFSAHRYQDSSGSTAGAPPFLSRTSTVEGLWYAPGVGMVRSTITTSVSGSFSLKDGTYTELVSSRVQ